MTGFKVVSPVDGSVYVERQYSQEGHTNDTLEKAKSAFLSWKETSIDSRIQICTAFADLAEKQASALASEITWQMGRPSSQACGEIRGLLERARYMTEVCRGALADVDVETKAGFTRFIRKEPLGVVFVVAAWNYPYLIAVNSIVPAILAGNAVILKHSAQTPLCAERFLELFTAAGLPPGVLQVLHLTHEETARVVADDRVSHVAFTGSVAGGRAIEHAAKQQQAQFIDVGLELGGKDAAYVRADCNLSETVAGLVDGAFFNSGQSCCGVERIYVHADVYEEFVKAFVVKTKEYVLGDPTDTKTTLGPMATAAAADTVRKHIKDAVTRGAQPMIEETEYSRSKPGTPYLAPQVLLNVDHSMAIMTEETFGPVVGIMKVSGDDEAVQLINDSPYGLTASVWTSDCEVALDMGNRIAVGTVFCNRCDYLDPALAWVGVRQSGRGCTLSRIGFDHLTRPKSFHIRHICS